MKRTLIAVLALTIALAAVAQPGGPPMPGPQGGPHERRGPGGFLSPKDMADFLALSETQKTQAKALHESLRTTIQPLREQMRANREAVKAAVDAGDAAKAGQLLISGKAIRDKIKAAHDTFETQFASMLNAEQKSKWTVLQQLKEIKRKHRGPRES